MKARTFFSSVRFAKITSIMILLAKEQMWLLKVDLWKMGFLKNSIWAILSSWQKFSPFIYFKRSVFFCKPESHNSRGILKLPACKLLRLIWFLGDYFIKDLQVPRKLSSLVTYISMKKNFMETKSSAKNILWWFRTTKCSTTTSCKIKILTKSFNVHGYVMQVRDLLMAQGWHHMWWVLGLVRHGTKLR